MSLSPAESALLLASLRALAAVAPCRSRIEAVVDAVAGASVEPVKAVPASLYARALSISAVIWAIDSGRVSRADAGIAQGVMDEVWRLGPIRPQLLATQLHCLVGQAPADRRCLWTCPLMARSNAGYATGDEPGRAALHGLLGRILATEGARIHTEAEERWLDPAGAGLPRSGESVRCHGCGQDGTVLGQDIEDGWTVVEHHPSVVLRDDGMWAVDPESVVGARQCGYLARRNVPVPPDPPDDD